MLCLFSGFYRNPYVREQLGIWYPGARQYAQDNGYSLLDLFYWEQRMGHWGGQFLAEQDIAMEEITPYNNRILINSLIQVNYKKRRSPNYTFYQKLIQTLWPEALSEPINPDKSYLKKIAKRNTTVLYFALKGKSVLFK